MSDVADVKALVTGTDINSTIKPKKSKCKNNVIQSVNKTVGRMSLVF